MRSGGYTLQQSLSSEAATIVRQAISFARRRGHAQVTPLHVASTMLASSTGLLKRACLKSNSHPLQCRALELCFNVALNRLPTSASSPLLSPHSHLPSLSNALIAAFKRAQAHQRRGSIENQQQQQQQQPILALKVEIEQLIISILDDPSISRVMREAGFSSTQVKANVEQAVSLENCNSQGPVLSCKSKEITKSSVLGNSLSLGKTESFVKNDDVMSVFEALMNKKTRNSVIVSECSSTAERIVRRVIDKFDKKDVPADMKFVQFISVPLFTLQNVSKQEFEVKLGELRSLVKTYMCSGVVLFLGNLDWISEFWSNYREQRKGFYCPVEYMIMELSRLINGVGENRKLWLMGIATFKTYAKCKSGHPSLETLWSLYPLTIPDRSLSLSLSLDSDMHDQLSKEALDDFSLLFQKAGVKKNLICCSDCSVNFKREAQVLMNAKQEFNTIPCSSKLPSWLQQYKDENVKQLSIDQECEKIKDLCKRWNSICCSLHKKPHLLETVFNLSSSSPSTSISSNDHNKMKLHKTLLNWPVIFEPNIPPKDHQIFINDNETEVSKPSFTNYLTVTKPDLLSNPNSSPNSASSSETSGDMEEFKHKFKEFNSENIKILCKTLEKNVPWQRGIIPEIVTTILKCRSGMKRSKSNLNKNREESWLLFLGLDSSGKETIARELAKTVFGSYDDFNPISLSSFSSTRADSTEEVSNNKRARNEHGGSPFERFLDGIRDNPSRVFFMEDFDQQDYHSLKGFKRAIEDGIFTHSDGEEVVFKDAIVIFSCESFTSASRACSPPIKPKIDQKEKEEHIGLLDLNITTEDCNQVENSVSDQKGILDLVDDQFVFKIQVL